METCQSFSVKIFMAGPIDVVKQLMREHFSEIGGCATITPTDYMYTSGEEAGYIIEFINYARFPNKLFVVRDRAIKLAYTIMLKTNQRSCSVVDNHISSYLQITDIENNKAEYIPKEQ